MEGDLLLDTLLDALDRVARLNVNGRLLARKQLHNDLHRTPKTLK